MAAVYVAPHPAPHRSAPRRPVLRVVSSAPLESPSGRLASSARRLPASVYRRRRVVVVLAVLAAVLVALAARSALVGTADELAVLTSGASAPVADVPVGAASTTTVATVYVVRPGDTVWSIAERLQPEGDVRDLVDQLTERAGGSALQAGQRLALDGLSL